MLLGTASADITPSTPVELCGFAMRSGVFERIRAPIYLQVFAFGTDAVLVCADLLWWGPDVVAELRRRVIAELDIDADRLVLHASHTHCAPTPGMTFSPAIGAGDEDYVAFLVDKTLATIREALASFEEVTMSRGSGEALIGVGRRRANPDGTFLGPDPGLPVDNEVVLLSFFRTADASAKAYLVHHTCHPVTSASRQVSPDYPGAMRDRLPAEITVGFLQGCCGDINPLEIVEDGEFVRAGTAKIAPQGARLADTVQDILVAGLEDVPPAEVSVRQFDVDLPLHAPSLHVLAGLRSESTIWGEWASWLLTDPSRIVESVPLRLTVLQLGESLTLLGLAAEVTVPYQLWMKERFAGKVLPIAYTNGMVGYVPTAEQIRQGGYEPDESYPYVYRSGPFPPSIEEIVKQTITRSFG